MGRIFADRAESQLQPLPDGLAVGRQFEGFAYSYIISGRTIGAGSASCDARWLECRSCLK